MLELVEIFDGVFLFLTYIALTVFLPIALLGFLIGFVAVLVRTLLGLVFGAAGSVVRVATPANALGRGVRTLVLTVVPWMLAIVVVLLVLSRANAELASGSLGGAMSAGVRVIAEALAKFQDDSMRFWTARSLEDVLAVTGEADGLRPLSVFTALVAARLYEAFMPQVTLETFRWVFAISFGSVALVLIGAAPLGPLLRLRPPALPSIRVTAPGDDARVPQRASVAADARPQPTNASAVAPAAPPPPPPRAVTSAPPRAAAASAAPRGGRDIAVVTSRPELSGALESFVMAAGVGGARPFATLEEYEAAAPADAVLLDARLLRWATGSPTTNERRSRTIIFTEQSEDLGDVSGFAGVLSTASRPDDLRAVVARLPA